MSKTVEWSISSSQNKGIVKMIGLLINMIQDHDVNENHMIGTNERTLLSLHQEVRTIANRGTYNESEKEFLNEVRNLVLQYQNSKKEQLSWDDELTWAMNIHSMKLNSKGQIINRF